MKTIEEAAREYSKDDNSYEPEDDCFLKDLAARSFEAGAKFAQRWISVEEELPENTMKTITKGDYKYTEYSVLVKSRNNRYTIVKRKEFLDHGWRWSGSTAFNDSVTHWRLIELK
jgi:hypothetical protein